MKKLLLEMFGDLKKDYPDFQVIGKEIVFSLDEERYAKIAFTNRATTGTPGVDLFNGCRIDIMDRNSGKLDAHMIAFEDVFDSILDLNHANKIRKYIWNYDGYDWYGKPTQKDLQDFRNSVKGYLDLLRVKESPEQKQEMVVETEFGEKLGKESLSTTLYLNEEYRAKLEAFTGRSIEGPDDFADMIWQMVDERLGILPAAKEMAVETELGEIVVREKSDTNYPGVMIDLRGERVNDLFEAGMAALATIEFDPETKGIRMDVYQDGESEERTDSIIFESILKDEMEQEKEIGSLEDRIQDAKKVKQEKQNDAEKVPGRDYLER